MERVCTWKRSTQAAVLEVPHSCIVVPRYTLNERILGDCLSQHYNTTASLTHKPHYNNFFELVDGAQDPVD